jgi:hypothetical protein
MVVALSRGLYAAVVLGAISVISAGSAAPSEFRPLAAVGHPSQAYFGSLPPGAPLPTGSQCAEDISATPETVPREIYLLIVPRRLLLNSQNSPEAAIPSRDY